MKMRLNSLLPIIAVLCITIIPLPTNAFHPLITDDTGTQGKGNVEIEMAHQYDYDRYKAWDRSVPKASIPDVAGLTALEELFWPVWGKVHVREFMNQVSMTMAYGIVDPLDIIIGVPYIHSRAKEFRTFYLPDSGYQFLSQSLSSTSSGMGDPLVEFKWNFFQYKGLSLAIKPGITIPIGNEDEGLGAGQFAPYGYFIATFELERFVTHLNLGYIRNQNNQNERKDLWHASLAMEFIILKDLLKFVANMGLERNPSRRSNIQDAFILGGVVLSPSENCDLDLGFKYSIAPKGVESSGADYSVLAGLTARFVTPAAEEKK